ncbi:MAG: M56 family metallopeptidase, partial [Oscillospiraceae bacterium]|nr:M56 family metallopeptidase [Oscillospiraceae bacterium]
MKDLLIPSSALILAILLIRLLFRRAISRRVQYALWFLVLLRLLVPVNLPAVAPSVLSAARPVQKTVETVAELPLHLLPYAAYPVADDTASELPGTAPTEQKDGYEVLFDTHVVDADGEAVVFYRPRIQPAQVLNAIWYVGMAGMALWLLAANLRFGRKLRRTRVPLNGAGSRLPVYLCDDIPSPCLFGLFRPAIYVTSAAAREPERLRYVLAHEETHARHLDMLWSLLRMVCLAVWWFDPLVWLAAHCARQDCELACDEGTLARLGEGERLAYGETLLALIPRRGGGAMLAATTMTAGKRQMKDRIQRIAEHRRPIVLALVLALALTGAACAVTFTGAANGADAGESPASAPTDAASASDLRAGERALSGAELEYFNERFFNQPVLIDGSWESNLHNQFLNQYYDSPEDIDLFALFYCGTGTGFFPLSDAEFALVGTDVCPTDKLPVSEMDAAFYANTGLHLSETRQVGLDRFAYLPEYDAYYHTHGDTNYMGVTIRAGARAGDTVRLWRDNGDWDCVTLRETSEGWHFLSNRPSEKPMIPTPLPEGEPWAVISLDAIEPSELPPVTLAAPEQFPERLGGWLANDAGVVVRLLVAQDGTTCAAVEEGYENGVTTARRFFTFPADAKNPNVRGFRDLFGYDRGLIVLYDGEIARNTYGKRCAYYVFSEDGTPTQLAEIPCFGDLPDGIDLDGDGKNELVSAG